MGSSFSKEQLRPAIFDFYILSQGVPASFNDDGRLRDYRIDLLNRWRRTLIRDIEYCIACELRHIHDKCGKPLPHGTGWPSWFKKHFGEVGDLWYAKYRNIAKRGRKLPPKTDNPEFNEDVSTIFQAHQGASKQRLNSYVASKIAEGQHWLSLIEVCNKIYDPQFSLWSSSYGGAKWQRVANTLFRLWLASDPVEIVHLIDVAFALQHNTAIVFNKNKLWCGPDNYVWIMNTLDVKWAANSPESILGHASSTLQDAVRDLGFNRTVEVPPAKHHIKPHVGMNVTMQERGETFQASIQNIAGSYFKSIRVESSHFNVQKQAGKYSKTINFRIFSHEELLNRVKSVVSTATVKPGLYAKDTPLSVSSGDNKPLSNMPAKKKAEQDAIYMKVKAALSTAYEALSTYVESKGYSLGSFLETQPRIRFRLKGHSKPMRIYFTYLEGKLICKIGNTEDSSESAAKKVKTFSTFSAEAVYIFLIMKVNEHLGA